MKRFPHLKEFVKYGGAELFENVEVEFRAGSNAVLTIFHDGTEYEKVELTSLKTKDEMHRLMLDKGFVLKPSNEVEIIQQKYKKQKDEEERERNKWLTTEQLEREKIIDEYRKTAESFAGSPRGDEVSKLTATIKKLKMEGHNDSSVAELEKRRVQLLRQQLLTRHHQLDIANALQHPGGMKEL